MTFVVRTIGLDQQLEDGMRTRRVDVRSGLTRYTVGLTALEQGETVLRICDYVFGLPFYKNTRILVLTDD